MTRETNREEIEKKRGETFYEALPSTVVVPREVSLPKISTKTADFMESIVLFFAGTVEVLLILRILLMILGVNGGNLLTYLLYAVSYPFVILLNSSQGQIPEMTNNVLYENVALLIIYFMVFYGLIKIINAFRSTNLN